MATLADDNAEMDLFANIYHHFLRSLKDLASEPEQQCENNDWDNVAWHIKYDAECGIGALQTSPTGDWKQIKLILLNQ